MKNLRRAVARASFLGLAVASLVTSGAAMAADQIAIGLITKTDTNPFFVKMKQGAEEAAAKGGVKLITAAGKFDGDNATQVTAAENMMRMAFTPAVIMFSTAVTWVALSPSNLPAAVMSFTPPFAAASSAPCFILTKNGLVSVLVIRPIAIWSAASAAPELASDATASPRKDARATARRRFFMSRSIGFYPPAASKRSTPDAFAD